MWRAGQRACFLAPWHIVPRQDIQRQLVGLAVEVFEQGVVEEGVVGGSSQEQGHAGPEFQMVGVGKDLINGATLYFQDKLGTFSDPGAQDGMLQIGLGLVEGANGELLCHRTMPETGDLWKDKPDPVTGLSAGSKLSEDCVVDGLLRGEEAVEIVNICHGQCP